MTNLIDHDAKRWKLEAERILKVSPESYWPMVVKELYERLEQAINGGKEQQGPEGRTKQ